MSIRRLRRETKVISDLVAEKIVNAAITNQEQVIIHLFRHTFLRRIDIAKLRVEQIDFINKWVEIREQQKTGTRAIVPLSDRTIQVIRSYIIQDLKNKTKGYMFPSKKGRQKGFMSPRNINNIFNRICKNAGFEEGFITPHDFRATFFTKSKYYNIPESMLGQISGTSLQTIHKHYTKFTPEDIEEKFKDLIE